MWKKIKILHLEDNSFDEELIKITLNTDILNINIKCIHTKDDFINNLKKNKYDLILADYDLPSFDGLSALKIAKRNYPDIPFIFVSGAIGEELAIELMKNGATDYVLKDRLERLIPSIKRAFNERKEKIKRQNTEKKLRESEEKYRRLFEQSNDAIFIHNIYGMIIDLNECACHILSNKKENLIKTFVPFYFLNKNNQLNQNDFKKRLQNDVNREELRLLAANGNYFYIDVSTRIIDKKKKTYQSIARDITDRKKWEDKIKKSLLEKEVLLKEIHHRVKNNMQLIISLLNLQALSTNNVDLILKVKESENRIRTMSLIHEKLYQSDDFSKINISNYTKDLINMLLSSFEIVPKNLNFDINVENIFLEINKAIPFGLILNEIISNSIKYAFINISKPVIKIKIYTDNNNYICEIGDNGNGLKNDIIFHKQSTLGFQLIHTLISQLSGSIEKLNTRGVNFYITFPKI